MADITKPKQPLPNNGSSSVSTPNPTPKSPSTPSLAPKQSAKPLAGPKAQPSSPYKPKSTPAPASVKQGKFDSPKQLQAANRKKIMAAGFAPRIDLKNLNAPIEKRNINLWNKDKTQMQEMSDNARKAYKDKWIKNNPRPEHSLKPISQEEWEGRAPDLLKTGLDHQYPGPAIQARDFLFDNLKEQLGDGYDDEDIKEYANQYFNMSPEKAKQLEEAYKATIPPKGYDPEKAEEQYMRENYAPDYDYDKEGYSNYHGNEQAEANKVPNANEKNIWDRYNKLDDNQKRDFALNVYNHGSNGFDNPLGKFRDPHTGEIIYGDAENNYEDKSNYLLANDEESKSQLTNAVNDLIKNGLTEEDAEKLFAEYNTQDLPRYNDDNEADERAKASKLFGTDLNQNQSENFDEYQDIKSRFQEGWIGRHTVDSFEKQGLAIPDSLKGSDGRDLAAMARYSELYNVPLDKVVKDYSEASKYYRKQLLDFWKQKNNDWRPPQ